MPRYRPHLTPLRPARMLVAAGLAAVLAAPLGIAAPASAADRPAGTRSLAATLAADGAGFDGNRFDYDIVDGAVRAVLAAKPDSPVAVLADGTVPLTAFLPNDRAFRLLANDVLGRQSRSEQRVLADLAGALGVETVEAVLLYHVVPGARIDYHTALGADGAALATALAGASLTVDVKRLWVFRFVTLVDGDPDERNAVVVQQNLNRRNLQIAHGIDRVLRPSDL